jgi:hypothetical protein
VFREGRKKIIGMRDRKGFRQRGLMEDKILEF